MNLCPSCKNDDPARAGSSHRCMDCGRLLGSRASKRERPDARHLTILSITGGKRFRGRASAGVAGLAIGVLVMLGVVAATIASMGKLSGALIAILAGAAALAALGLVLTVLHYSEVDVTAEGVEIRSFPFGGRSAGKYPRAGVTGFGWIRVPGPKGTASYDVHIALEGDRTVRVPIAAEGQAQCVYVARKLRTAFARTAPPDA